MSINRSNILRSMATDAYKASHFLQLPPNTKAVRFYIAPRRALAPENQQYLVFGIRYFIERYLQIPITLKDIEDIQKIWNSFNVGGSSYDFPVLGFQKIATTYQGLLPIKIVGVKEGQILTQYNTPIFVISVDDPDLVWLPGFIETALQRSIWYPSTVATISFNIKQELKKAYEQSVCLENYDSLKFRLHDFGARGASSGESAAIGGLAHLLNFMGTDTMEAVYLGHQLYGIPIHELASSIPATEHSTVTSWGNGFQGEREALLNLIKTCETHHNKVFSFVSDSYDYFHTIDHLWGDPEIIQLIKLKKLYPVVRPDSGDPIEVVLYALESLSKTWGYSTNKKGFKVLDTIRIIQGDGMNSTLIKKLVDTILKYDYSVENVAFGMGGGLLQKLNRDSMSWSMKMYKLNDNGIWRDIQKNPLTQQNKQSFNPQNIVNDKDWVIHYHWDKNMEQPTVFNESFQNIRKRTNLDSIIQ
ncbi:MAG: nicotinate phosphoribosyltransferase [Brevinema sp.]